MRTSRLRAKLRMSTSVKLEAPLAVGESSRVATPNSRTVDTACAQAINKSADVHGHARCSDLDRAAALNSSSSMLCQVTPCRKATHLHDHKSVGRACQLAAALACAADAAQANKEVRDRERERERNSAPQPLNTACQE